MPAEIHTLAGASRAKILRVEAVDEEADALLRGGGFDGVELSSDAPSFETLAPYGDTIRWLYASTPASAEGLESLQQLQRITFVGSQSGLRFDYKQLKHLKTFQCDAADLIPVKFLNHPGLECLDVCGAQIKDFTALAQAQALRFVRLVRCRLKSTEGIDQLTHLQELRLMAARTLTDISSLASSHGLSVLEIQDAVKLADVSAIHGLAKLRLLFVDAPTAQQDDLNWLAAMPDLECAGLWVRTRSIDWGVLAAHPRLYDVALHGMAPAQFGGDEEITRALASRGRVVKKLTRFPKSTVPALRIEFVPSPAIADPKPLFLYQGKLLSQP